MTAEEYGNGLLHDRFPQGVQADLESPVVIMLQIEMPAVNSESHGSGEENGRPFIWA